MTKTTKLLLQISNLKKEIEELKKVVRTVYDSAILCPWEPDFIEKSQNFDWNGWIDRARQILAKYKE